MYNVTTVFEPAAYSGVRISKSTGYVEVEQADVGLRPNTFSGT